MVDVFEGENMHSTEGNITFGFENTKSGFMITIGVAGRSKVLPKHDIWYTLQKNEALVLKCAIEAYLKMQPNNMIIIEE